MKRRPGFTLVELLVSMALIIFMMAILSQAFASALGVFRDLKGQGDLAEKLRSTSQILQHDLAADHFGSNRRLSDPYFWNNGPPQQGFFQVFHGSPSNLPIPVPNYPTFNFIEGIDAQGLNSYRSTDHKLAFTVKLVGNDIGDFMSASALGSGNVWDPVTLTPVVPQLPGNPPPNTPSSPPNGLGIGAIGINPANHFSFGPPESRYQALAGVPGITGYNSQWAAVSWFLMPQMNPNTLTQDTTAADKDAGTLGFPLYTLYRRQCLLVPDNNLVTLATMPQGAFGIPSTLIAYFLEMSCLPDPSKGSTIINFNSPRDITMPVNHILSGWGGQPIYTPILPPTSPLAGSDIQLNDVVSFDVRLLPLYPNGVPTSPYANDQFVTLWDAPFWNGPTPYNPTPSPTNFTFTYTPPVSGAVAGATPMVFDTWSSNSTGIPGYDYSAWNIPGVNGLTIPYWTLNQVNYQYPVGTGRYTILPGALTSGAANLFKYMGSGPIIRAIQVTIRIWDFKTNQTRQVTIVQAM